ncbi:MAG: TetR/AcrR family transcriptional regulator [Bacteroidota bacterium]|nr:TetR/AcrR family transcriptional regulator [Bacteroidota bacterium]
MNKSDARKENLVTAAQKCFSKFGFQKSTMNDIAREARKGKSSLYYYFKSKEEIFEAVVKTEAEIFKTEVKKTLNQESDLKTRVRLYFTIRMKRFKELVNLYAAMRSNYLKNQDFIEKIRETYDREELEFIQSMLEEGVEKNEFKVKSITDTSYALASALKGLEFPLVFNPTEQKLNERIDALLNILFYGIVKK